MPRPRRQTARVGAPKARAARHTGPTLGAYPPSYQSYRSDGGLLPPDMLAEVVSGRHGGQAPKDFGCRSDQALRQDIDAAWAEARSFWASLQQHLVRWRGSAEGGSADENSERRPAPARTTSVTRDLWLVPLMRILGFDLERQAQGVQTEDGQAFVISHLGVSPSGVPVHLLGMDSSLTQREVGRMRQSPYSTVQQYLNHSDQVWGIVSNGRELWVLRETHRVARPAYIAWDLESMMEGGRYEDFRALYRLCHASRFPMAADLAAQSWIEKYWAEAQGQGSRIRDRLRDGVEGALRTLGIAFLAHPDNEALREAFRTGAITGEGYYRELLRLIYRLLFLMVAEERQMLLPPDDLALRHIYDAAFSVERLRTLAEKPGFHPAPDGADLWRGLVDTFELFSYQEGQAVDPHFAVPPLNGELFSPRGMPHLTDASLDNRSLMAALAPLSRFEADGEVRRVNYASLDVEELGSVYESLLEYVPVVSPDDGRFQFVLGGGTDRKSTGSYYTPQELVGALIESALDPVIQERRRMPDPERRLLELSICDPACGSGHFLLAAARRVARALAQVRTNEPGDPAPEKYREALRDVIEHSVYGVDKNPLAVDLCKVALWIEGHNAGRPLSFLDHHIKRGDSLVGVVNSDQLPTTIPDDAYAVKTGDDPAVAKQVKKMNREQTKGVQRFDDLFDRWPDRWRLEHLAIGYEALGRMSSAEASAVQEKERSYHKLRDESADWTAAARAADMATAPFFATLDASHVDLVPTTRDLQTALRDQEVPGRVAAYARQLAERQPFFHWSLEFPDVFARGGFDVVLGNPPWERVKLQHEEWFSARRREVSLAANKAVRTRLIQELAVSHPELWNEFRAASHESESLAGYARGSGRYPLSHVGDVNTYALFLELGREVLNDHGRLGMVVPTAIATDYTYRAFFGDLLKTGQLVSLYDLENRFKIFPGVHSSYKFALLTLSRRRVERAQFAFFLTRPDDMRDPERVFAFTGRDLAQVNPNTATCPVFRTRADADITAKMYRRVPVLVNQRTRDNPWGIRFFTMFHMANDSGLFRGDRGADRLPLYEAKMMHQYDHRFGTYEGDKRREVSAEEHQDPHYRVQPHYWVDKAQVAAKMPSGWDREWFVGFHGIARATDSRTVIAGVVPAVAVGNSLPLVVSRAEPRRLAGLVADLSSMVLDYAARQKVGGTNLNFFLLEQFPVLPPDQYGDADLAFIVPRVLELSYTAWDLSPFARDLGYGGPPFGWDEERRAGLRAELDGYYAHLYGLTREELQYILDPATVKGPDFPGETFRSLKDQEWREYGEFRTYRLVLDAYDRLAADFASGDGERA